MSKRLCICHPDALVPCVECAGDGQTTPTQHVEQPCHCGLDVCIAPGRYSCPEHGEQVQA